MFADADAVRRRDVGLVDEAVVVIVYAVGELVDSAIAVIVDAVVFVMGRPGVPHIRR